MRNGNYFDVCCWDWEVHVSICQIIFFIVGECGNIICIWRHLRTIFTATFLWLHSDYPISKSLGGDLGTLYNVLINWTKILTMPTPGIEPESFSQSSTFTTEPLTSIESLTKRKFDSKTRYKITNKIYLKFSKKEKKSNSKKVRGQPGKCQVTVLGQTQIIQVAIWTKLNCLG